MESVQLELPITPLAAPWVTRRQAEHPGAVRGVPPAQSVDSGSSGVTDRRLRRPRLKRVGIGMLFEVLRWQYGRATRGEPWKLNNDFRSRYVRKLLERHPEWSPLFETRGHAPREIGRYI